MPGLARAGGLWLEMYHGSPGSGTSAMTATEWRRVVPSVPVGLVALRRPAGTSCTSCSPAARRSRRAPRPRCGPTAMTCSWSLASATAANRRVLANGPGRLRRRRRGVGVARELQRALPLGSRRCGSPRPGPARTADLPPWRRCSRWTGSSKAYGPRTVLSDVSLIVPDDARIGVVGPNGIGKSTLLRVMAGVEPPDDGRVLRAPPTLRVGLLDQRGRPAREETVAEHLARRTGVAAAEERLDALTAALADDPGAGRRVLRGPGGVPRPRRRRPRGPRRRGAAEVGLAPDRLDVPMSRALGRAGRPRRAGGADPRPRRPAPARRADQRPRLRRPRDPRAPRGRPSRARS